MSTPAARDCQQQTLPSSVSPSASPSASEVGEGTTQEIHLIVDEDKVNNAADLTCCSSTELKAGNTNSTSNNTVSYTETSVLMSETSSTLTSSNNSASIEDTRKAMVSFRNLEIREYPIIVGDNPSVSSGVPICIDWIYIEGQPQCLEEYEELRHSRRSLAEMKIPAAVRAKMLRKTHSLKEVRLAQKESTKIRNQRKTTVATLDTGIEAAEVVLESAKRKMKRLLARKKRANSNGVCADI
mmetsp:Transcript_26223/g.40647  ORF Transcript_26223/g.40647 Transcript_26223/m.40647 type:complete len:241 (-) Transcript_26223:189-911(-)|eukprot:CAMPEP_0196821572 /NCGR_PEP_ID=MMETSP1362-20130617/79907_1 /TAXON_ID=163516 /ORGANISM="Leptocylindrus danicus, Strain CCMP1856" /LENGTH=240 /DNA_ID=CAMNT_0042200807 /DNA_START=62 /DNA_END=784 /DNA_ORIENTATION=-